MMKKVIEFVRHVWLKIRIFNNRHVLYDFDENWFKGKRVAIVGGADSVLHDKLGDYIDAFDVVVRLNKGVEPISQQSEYIGTRTDFLFHCFYDSPEDLGSSPTTPELWKENNVTNLVFASNVNENENAAHKFLKFVYKTKGKYLFTQLPLNLLDSFVNLIPNPYKTTTGFVAINSIFKCNPSEIYLTGFTFFRTSHNKLYRSPDFDSESVIIKGAHNADLEFYFIKEMYLHNKNIIKPDAILKAFFDK